MPGDYISQLQLARQLEQKAREAARNREEAEKKIDEAEKALASLREFDTQSADAQRFFLEAKEAFSNRDFKTALSLAIKSIEATERTKAEKVEAVISSITDLLSLFERGERDYEEIINLIQKTRNFIAEKRLKEALSSVTSAWNKAEQYVNRKLADYFGKVQSLLLLAESNGIGVDEERKMLAHARKWLDELQYASTIKELNACFDRIKNLIHSHLELQVGKILDFRTTYEELGIDFSPVDKIIAQARKEIEEGDYDRAFRTIKMGEIEVQNRLNSGIRSTLERIRKRVEFLETNGIETGRAKELIQNGLEFVSTQRIAEAREALKDLKNVISKGEEAYLVRLISSLRTKLVLAKRLGVDLDQPLALLESSKGSFKSGDFESAIDFVRKADGILEKALEGYKEVERELSKTRQLLLIGSLYPADLRSAKELMNDSRELVLARNFSGAVEKLKAAQKEANRAIQEHFAKAVMDLELKAATAVRMGADLTEEHALLDRIIKTIKEGNYIEAAASIKRCNEMINEKMKLTTKAMIATAQKYVEDRSKHVDVSAARSMIADATAALENGEFEKAYDLAQAAIESLRKSEEESLSNKIQEAKKLLDLAERLGAVSITLSEKLKSAEQLRDNGETSESFRIIIDVINFASSIVADELTRELTKLIRSIGSARRNGVEVKQIDRLAEEASLAINAKDFERAFNIIKETGELLNKTKALHTEIYDRIVEISSLLREAKEQGKDTSEAVTLLTKGKRLFETGKYEEAKTVLTKCYSETEKIVAPFIATRRIPLVRDLIAIMKRIGLETSPVEKMIADAEANAKMGRYLEALNASGEAERIATTSLIREISMRIENLKSQIARAKKSGRDVRNIDQIIRKAEQLLWESRFNDALKALDLAKAEIDQNVVMERRANEHIQISERVIDEVASLGIDVTSARNSLGQAINLRDIGKFIIASELARKAAEQASQLATTRIKNELEGVEEFCRKEGLKGIDLEAARSSINEVDYLIERWHFRQAKTLIDRFSSEIRRIQQQKQMSTQTINEVKEQAKRAKELGLRIEHVEKLISQADERMRNGAFSEAFAIAMRCSEDLRSILESYEKRLNEIHKTEKLIELLEKNGRDISELSEKVKSAREALQGLEFEKAALLIQRAMISATSELNSLAKEKMKKLHSLYQLLSQLSSETEVLQLGSDIGQMEMGERGAPNLEVIEKKTEAIESLLFHEIGNRITKLRERIDKEKKAGKEVSLSEFFIATAKESLDTKSYGEAIEALEKVEKSIGISVEKYKEFENTKEKLTQLITEASRRGIPVEEGKDVLIRASRWSPQEIDIMIEDLKNAISSLENKIEMLIPEITIDMDLLGEPIAGQWTGARIHLRNKAIAMVRDIALKFHGDLDVKGPLTIEWMKGQEEVSLDLKIMPKRSGVLPIALELNFKPAFSDENYRFESTFEIEVQESKS
ncbi:MAG: hypothetical protein QHH00_00510 [Methanomassiliicoccales archaeon]|nr:hypothetical protein [Methanomassiliicoccales archaeon]